MTRMFDPAALLAQAASRFPGEYTDQEMADYLGVTLSQLRHWRTGRRPMSGGSADRAACAVGLHPVLLWPDYYATERV